MSRRLMFRAALALTIPLAGCTAAPRPAPVPPPTGMRLVAYDSCQELFADLRKTAKANVGPFGFSGGSFRGALTDGGARTMADSASAKSAAPPAFSGTNVHEQGADEPDLVKTDGRRIVTVSRGYLRVVDPATRQETGRLDLNLWAGDQLELLLSGDRALVLSRSGHPRVFADKKELRDKGPQMILVDLTGTPRVLSRYEGEGALVDARLTDGTARVVLRTAPRITFRDDYSVADDAKRVQMNREAIDSAPDDAWLPRWKLTTGTETSTGKVDCGRVSRPTDYSGGSLVSVLTFDLTRPTLGTGDAVTVVADGDTVYGTAGSLYLASDERWRIDWFPGRAAVPVRQETDLYKFSFTANQPPVFRAAGKVPGFLINQYALSEWDGHLRVATTDARTERSAVRVLAERDGKLAPTGVVDGLGKGEQIYSVRFVGARGYVVTFKQTDPLYSLDLSDPAQPAVTGELKINGYSAHLQPIGENRLIGIGQEADDNGRTQGTQVSLFDVSDPADPRRLAQYHLATGYSEAEFDPHAVLWWPAANRLVIPMTTFGADRAESFALNLRVTDDLTRVDELTQPGNDQIRRSLVVGDDLWTVSDAGLQASELSTLDRLSWLPA